MTTQPNQHFQPPKLKRERLDREFRIDNLNEKILNGKILNEKILDEKILNGKILNEKILNGKNLNEKLLFFSLYYGVVLEKVLFALRLTSTTIELKSAPRSNIAQVTAPALQHSK